MNSGTQVGKWPERRRPPEGAPNVLVVLTDDVGFGACSTFGGPIQTPVLDKLAAEGLRYTRFHTTAMCSPTRASLLTGRNPHAVNMGRIANYPTGVDGYTAVIPDSAGTIADVLRANGYSTGMFGKSHVTPPWELNSTGPFDRWPTGLGFDYFWGFLLHETNQWAPSLVENTTFIDPPENSRHFDEVMATRAIDWIAQQRAEAPDRPFFVYYAPGTAHTPHHAPEEWIEKYRGAFDPGWDELRQRTFERQKSTGVIPQDTELPPRHDELPAWDSLSPDEQRLGARFMEAYAGAISHCDHQFGRVVDALEQMGEIDNTLIIFVQGDNGGSAEGGLRGLLVSLIRNNGYEEDPDYVLSRIDDIGGPYARSHFPAAWAWATNTPFRYYKQVASHFGGTRNGMVVRWPPGIERRGEIRTQFHHVSDLMPTILEAAGIAAPAEISGVAQAPLDGTSMLYSFKAAEAPNARNLQIFECRENFGIYKDGWFAASTPANSPSVHALMQKPAPAPEDRDWELFDIRTDFSQSRDLAKVHPEKLKELQDEFWRRAAENKILPIHPATQYRGGRPTLGGNRDTFVYYGPMHSRIFDDAAPDTIGRSFEITAEIEIPEGGGNGVIVSHGGRFGGYALYLKNGVVKFHYNAFNTHQYAVKSAGPLEPGAHRIAARFDMDRAEAGSGGTLAILAGDRVLGDGRVERTMRSFSCSDGFHVGRDSTTPVCEDYRISESRFDGRLGKVVFKLSNPPGG